MEDISIFPSNLPSEILLDILTDLDRNEVEKCQYVNRLWNTLILNSFNILPRRKIDKFEIKEYSYFNEDEQFNQQHIGYNKNYHDWEYIQEFPSTKDRFGIDCLNVTLGRYMMELIISAKEVDEIFADFNKATKEKLHWLKTAYFEEIIFRQETSLNKFSKAMMSIFNHIIEIIKAPIFAKTLVVHTVFDFEMKFLQNIVVEDVILTGLTSRSQLLHYTTLFSETSYQKILICESNITDYICMLYGEDIIKVLENDVILNPNKYGICLYGYHKKIFGRDSIREMIEALIKIYNEKPIPFLPNIIFDEMDVKNEFYQCFESILNEVVMKNKIPVDKKTIKEDEYSIRHIFKVENKNGGNVIFILYQTDPPRNYSKSYIKIIANEIFMDFRFYDLLDMF